MKNTSDILGKDRTDAAEKGARKAELAGLQPLEGQEAKIELLRTALREGETSGEPKPFDMEKLLADKNKKRR